MSKKWIKTPYTNAMRIRCMTDEELAQLIGDLVDHDSNCINGDGCLLKQAGMCRYPKFGCDENALAWLKEEVEE